MALIPGVSPAGVSWVGHAGGFAAGLLAAWAQEKETPNAV
jgi:membrane associated rhomboid family serine protease